jgi:hypothetical protein
MDNETLEKFISSMGPTSFAELDEIIEANEKVSQMRQLSTAFHFLVDNVLASEDIGDKGAAIKKLADEFSGRLTDAAKQKGIVDTVVDYVKDKLEKPSPQESNRLMLVKNIEGEWVWFAKYSNKFRDNDNPPEIIAEQSHLGFVDKVNSGLTPYPELWLWHIPGTTWGKATWVGYDTNGFALAAGVVNPEFYDLAEQLHGREDILLSHGMPTKTISRDEEDSSIIVQHETREISVLPFWAAANKLTGFVVLKENTDMSEIKDKGIAPEDRNKLIDDLGLTPEVVDRMEASNIKDASVASAVGLEFKEESEEEIIENQELESEQAEEVEAVEAETEEIVEETQDDEPVTPVSALNLDDVTSAIDKMIGAIEALNTKVDERFEGVQSEMDALKVSQEAVAKEVTNTPLASRAGHMFESIIGKEETRIDDGRTRIAKDGPKETDPNQNDGKLFFQREGWTS